jgi:7-cyano-7-deazaguanine reductase
MLPGTPEETVATSPSRDLETVPNPAPGRVYRVRMVAPEFTCVCPRSGQPDFATLVVEYAPADRLVELKSLKLYFWSWRDEGIFHEAVVNRVLEDLAQALRPLWLSVTGHFKVRGGITTTVTATSGPPPDDLPEPAPPPGPHES